MFMLMDSLGTPRPPQIWLSSILSYHHTTIYRHPGAPDSISTHLKHVSILVIHQRWIHLFTTLAPKISYVDDSDADSIRILILGSSFRIFRPVEGAQIKSCTMMGSRVLQLSLLLVGLCQPFCASAPDASSSQEAGEVPVSQLKMLSLGLAHLLQGVDGNAKGLEQQGEHVATELDGATKNSGEPSQAQFTQRPDSQARERELFDEGNQGQ